jgi:FlaG/FlaF family flagellin (archaellin)
MGKMKANRKFVEGQEAVSAVIGVILMVAITVAIAATVYVYVSGMIGTSPESAPSIQFVKDASQMTLTVAQADPADLAWSDFLIVNGTGNSSSPSVYGIDITANIFAGDTLTFTIADTYKIRYVPTNTLMGEWTFA